MPITLTEEQASVFELIERTREHVFVTGKAGTGKSTLLDHLNWNTDKSIVICAPTGVAALNVGGQTIHSLFRLPVGVIADADIDLNDATVKLLNALDAVVIDEISMVNADLMDAIDRVLRMARQREEPFGGAQMVMFGDPYQLPPIEPRDPGEIAYFAEHYPSMWFFDAKVWRDVPMRVVELSQIHRQSDPRFTSLLNAVRQGMVTAEMAAHLNEIGARRPVPSSDIITLATRNDMVRRTNERQLATLRGASTTFEAEQMGEWGRTTPADESLELKVGAQVMFLRNDTFSGSSGPRWVNGSIGEVTAVKPTVQVRIAGEEVEVEPAEWDRYRYHFDAASKTLARELVASFRQLPLRLAWAVTIHKSQGASFDRAIVDLGAGAFANGQTYVALSRLTRIEGLYLTRPLRPADVRVDETVREFMRVVLPDATT
ncbi:MAG TPA: AAA family ATPase [Microbacteriaceae bacterium]|nr:AAA family ATPase [Microbacteriaceae bacterium]